MNFTTNFGLKILFYGHFWEIADSIKLGKSILNMYFGVIDPLILWNIL